ncbi:hypothetical protein ANN_05145 [Periplaneta americana]|uniref:Uncharacterized protein n=1 Tax=Periplaneta americana TaxID=6978 RepID=A0ABQ8TAB7_PERAM|nr:hypothetical protein ANN_05145 [Periplaneta americana]
MRLKLLHTSWDPVRKAKLCETLDITNTRRIDIIAFKEFTRSGFIIDPTMRFGTNKEQPAEVNKEKKDIYNPTIVYYLQKYQLKELEIIGLLVGAREYVIKEVQDNRECLELNGLHQLLVYANNVKMLGENPQTTRENTGILLEASKEPLAFTEGRAETGGRDRDAT